MKRFYTAESVTEGHPDKLCDLIADSILDECLKGDPEARVLPKTWWLPDWLKSVWFRLLMQLVWQNL